MNTDTPFKIEFLTIQTNNFRRRKLIKKELKNILRKDLKIFIVTEITIKYLVFY